MKPPPFTYHAPTTVNEAAEILNSDPESSKVLAGGQSLVPLLNLRLSTVGHLVDVNRVAEINRVDVEAGSVVVGAGARQVDVERSSQVSAALPLLTTAISHVGHTQNRNRGTVVGSLCHADPAAELPAVWLALGGELTAQSAGRTRTIQAEDFFDSFFTTTLESNEVATEVRFAGANGATGWSFEEIARRHGDFAIVGVVTLLTLDGAAIGDARISAFGVASTPVRIAAAEQLLVGETDLSDSLLDRVAVEVSAGINPPNDIHGSAEYRRYVAGILTRRGLVQALERARSAG